MKYFRTTHFLKRVDTGNVYHLLQFPTPDEATAYIAKYFEPAGWTIVPAFTCQLDFIHTVLSDDETSTNHELLLHLVGNGVPRSDAEWYVAHREIFKNSNKKGAEPA